jgi:hypothetical protein
MSENKRKHLFAIFITNIGIELTTGLGHGKAYVDG